MHFPRDCSFWVIDLVFTSVETVRKKALARSRVT